MNKKKIFILTSVVIIVIALGCCGAFWAFKTNAVITNDAVIEPEQIAINATDNGKIKDIFVKPDEEVESGQLVAEIEIKKTISQPVAKTKDTVEVSQKKLEDAEENHTNFAMMYKDGVISQQEYDKSLEQLEDAKKAVAEAKTPVKQKSVVSVVTKKVYAPKDGTIALSYVTKGETATKDKPLLLLDTENPKIIAYFNPKFQENLKVGNDVQITCEKYKGKTFEGVIEAISTEPEISVDKKSSVIPVTIRFKNGTAGYDFDKNMHLSVSLKNK